MRREGGGEGGGGGLPGHSHEGGQTCLNVEPVFRHDTESTGRYPTADPVARKEERRKGSSRNREEILILV